MAFLIKQRREQVHLTQDELAQKAGISRQTISNLENGSEQTRTTTETLIKLAAALDCTVSDIFCPE